MSVDYPRAWEIARATAAEAHHPQCSFRVSKGGILCDCAVLIEHAEYKDDVLQTAGGKVWRAQAIAFGELEASP